MEEPKKEAITLTDHQEKTPAIRNKRGSNGGNARAEKLTKEQRSAIAKKAAAKRWGKKKEEDNHCTSCIVLGQSLESGEGTHREGTIEHPATPVSSTPEFLPEATIIETLLTTKMTKVPIPAEPEQSRTAKTRKRPMVKEFGKAYSRAEKLLEEALKKRSDAIKVILTCNEDIPMYVNVIKSLGGTVNPHALKSVDIPSLNRTNSSHQYQYQPDQYQPAFEQIAHQAASDPLQNVPNIDPALFQANASPLPGLVPAAQNAPFIPQTAMGGGMDLDYIPVEEEPKLPKMGGGWQ